MTLEQAAIKVKEYINNLKLTGIYGTIEVTVKNGYVILTAYKGTITEEK